MLNRRIFCFLDAEQAYSQWTGEQKANEAEADHHRRRRGKKAGIGATQRIGGSRPWSAAAVPAAVTAAPDSPGALTCLVAVAVVVAADILVEMRPS